KGLVSEYDRDRRWVKTWLVNLDEPVGEENEPKLVWDRSSQDRYGDPGRPVTTTNDAGRSVVDVEVVEGEQWIYLDGNGASSEGDRPFLDRMNLETLETQRLWRNDGERYESFVALLEPDVKPTILTRHETPIEPPNYFALDL